MSKFANNCQNNCWNWVRIHWMSSRYPKRQLISWNSSNWDLQVTLLLWSNEGHSGSTSCQNERRTASFGLKSPKSCIMGLFFPRIFLNGCYMLSNIKKSFSLQLGHHDFDDIKIKGMIFISKSLISDRLWQPLGERRRKIKVSWYTI